MKFLPCLMLALIPAVFTTAAESLTDPVLLVEEALANYGGPAWLDEAGALVIEHRGYTDLGTRLQGRQWEMAERYPATEKLAVAADGRLLRESRRWVNADAVEHLQIRFEADSTQPLLLEQINNQAFRIPDDGSSARYRRTLPPLLLAEALRNRESLTLVGVRDDGARVLMRLTDEPDLVLVLAEGRLAAVEYTIEMPIRGETAVRWEYLEPTAATAPLPGGYRVFVDGRILQEKHLSNITFGSASMDAAFALPSGVTVPPAADGDGTEAAADRPRYITLAPGVHLAPGVRAGFHHLFVELDEYVAVVDAPTGWQEFDQLPAGEWVAGADDDAVARRLIEIVGEAVPDKPIRYLILTHHHSDHSGGFRPFLEIGARIVATSETVDLLERELNDPDASVEERFQIVESRERLGDGERTLEIIHVGPNPHRKGMLVAWLPEERILYQSDLFFPASEEHFPDRARLSVMRWFTDWLARSGLDPKEIRSIHGTSKVTAAQLERIREVAERRAVLISVDGLRADYLTKADAHGLRIPTLRALMTAGITAEGVVPPTPSNTMPGHTTLITGVWPDRHGILDNDRFAPGTDDNTRLYHYYDDIRVPTLLDAAEAAGLMTAGIGWPVTTGAPLDWLYPESPGDMPELDSFLLAATTSNLRPLVRAGVGDDDEARFRLALAALAGGADFLALHVGETDTAQHEHGPGSAEALAAIEALDQRLGMFLRTACAAGHLDDALVIVTADHGFRPLHSGVFLMPLFRSVGLLTTDRTAEITDWQAYPWPAAGASAIYLHPEAGPGVPARVEQTIEMLQTLHPEAVARVYRGEELDEINGFPGAYAVVALRPGYAFGAGFDNPLVRTPTRTRGIHGYVPDSADMNAALVAVGPHLQRTARTGVLPMTAVAPAIADWLHLGLGTAVQRAPDFAYRRGEGWSCRTDLPAEG